MRGLFDEKDRADDGATTFRNPGRFAGRIEVLDERGEYFGDQRFVAGIPAVFLGVYQALAVDDPADVSAAQRPQALGRLCRLRLEQVLDGSHGGEQCPALGRTEPLDQCADRLA